jgi:hypothetical protein
MIKIILNILFFILLIYNINCSPSCDTRCDCDQVAQGCPGPRFCRKPNPDDCASFWECNDGGLLYTMPCSDGLYYSDITLTCGKPEDSTCPAGSVLFEVSDF